jgi:hypothetical protein
MGFYRDNTMLADLIKRAGTLFSFAPIKSANFEQDHPRKIRNTKRSPSKTKWSFSLLNADQSRQISQLFLTRASYLEGGVVDTTQEKLAAIDQEIVQLLQCTLE